VRSATAVLVSLVVAASPAACGPRAEPATEPKARLAAATPGPDAPSARRAATRRATIKYEIRGRPFPLPLVTGTIAGQRVTMLVDTGANSHVVAGWFARKAGMPLKKLGDVGTDHVGKTISTFRIERPELAIDEWGPLDRGPVLATDVPEVIERLGIGAFISPQRLVEEGDAVLLNLAKGELRATFWDEAHDELSASGTPMVLGSESARACEENEGPIKGLAFVVPAIVESQRVHLLVDTGAQHSDLFTSSDAGQKLLAQSVGNKEPMYTASGKISARRLRLARVTAGAFAVTTDVDLIGGAADASCARDGVLAMDVLRSCALLLGRKRIYGRCAAPAAPPPHAKK
jgi:predicted aspartyl protease